MIAFYVLALGTVLVMVLVTLFQYASPKVDWTVKGVVVLAWFTNLSIVILVPIDVWTTLHSNHPTFISVMWSSAYWTTQILCWLFIPQVQQYEEAGDFTFMARLKTGIRHNLTFYATMGTLGIVGLVLLIVTGTLDWNGIVGFLIACSNTFGLVTGGLMLSYGLVELPRGLWRHADVNLRQRWLVHRVGRIAEKLDEAHQELSTAIVIAQATSNQMSRRDPLRVYMDIIDGMAAEDPSFKPTGGRLGESDMDYDLSVKTLAQLRKRLRDAREKYYRYKSEYAAVVFQALELEDTVKNMGMGASNDWKFVSTLRPPREGRLAGVLDRSEWLWRCCLRSILVQSLAVLLFIMSLALIFAEATIITGGKPDLSLPSLLIRGAQDNEQLVQIFTFIPLVYMCVATYFSVFKLGMFNFYYLVPKHTDSVSLLVNASLTCRFAAPMSYNFLNLIHVGDTIFDEKMGQMGNVPFLGNEFNTYFPILMVVFSFVIGANLFNRVLDLIGGSRRFRFDNEDSVDDFSAAGLLILRKERVSVERGAAVGESVVPLARNFGSAADLEQPPPPHQNGKTTPTLSPSPSQSDLPPRPDAAKTRRYKPPSERGAQEYSRLGTPDLSRPLAPNVREESPSASPDREGLGGRWGALKGSLSTGFSSVAEKIREQKAKLTRGRGEEDLQMQPVVEAQRQPSASTTLDNIFEGLRSKRMSEDEEEDFGVMNVKKGGKGRFR